MIKTLCIILKIIPFPFINLFIDCVLPMRCILLVLDGLGDKGLPCFEGKTPLQVADTPNLDHLASLGMNGLYHSHLQGTSLPSELAHFIMFGYDIETFPGRGPVEAVGESIALESGEVAALARIFSVALQNGNLLLKKENPALDAKTCKALQEAIKTFQHGGVELEFVPTKGIEGILLLRGDVSAMITDSNPIYEGRPLMEVTPHEGFEKDKSAVCTSSALNAYLGWCYQTLEKHPLNIERCQKGLMPINGVGTQRAGMKSPLPPFTEKWGLKGLSVSSGALYHGLCSLLTIDVEKVQQKENPGEDLLARLKRAKSATDYDFIHVHTKAPDQAAHTKDPRHKKATIESLDRALAYAIDEIATDETILLVITADHSTPSTGTMIHSGETVPLTMVGKYTRRDDVSKFNEVSCAGGALGPVRGRELMYLILNFLDRGKLWGLMDSPVDQPFSPGNYKPLLIDPTS
jgi:2,3-bisphosphoglycerate-independent phosphoglycerate mutase